MSTKLSTLADIHAALTEQGRNVDLLDSSVAVAFGSSEHPIVSVLTIEDENLVITCQLAKFGEIPEDNLAAFALAALDANTRIHPYSVGYLSDTDGQEGSEDEWPIVLINSVPLGDLSNEELDSAMESLLAAITGVTDVIRIGIEGIKEPCAA